MVQGLGFRVLRVLFLFKKSRITETCCLKGFFKRKRVIKAWDGLITSGSGLFASYSRGFGMGCLGRKAR